MVGITWTDKNIDLDFLVQQKVEYWEAHNVGEQWKRNPKKDAFIEKSYIRYIEAFPGRVDAFEFSDLGLGGTPEQRKSRMKKRLRDWFSNHLDNNAGNGGKKAETILNVIDTKGSRRETAYHAYYRIKKEKLKPEVDADCAIYKAECEKNGETPIPIARRNQFLSQRLKQESTAVKEEIELGRINGRNDGEIEALQGLFLADSEERVCATKRLQKNINKLAGTLEKVSDSIQSKTGWSVMILVGGPEPQRGGDIRTFGITKGAIQNCGKKFEDFCGNWDGIFDSFTRFCENVTPENDRKVYSMKADTLLLTKQPRTSANENPASDENRDPAPPRSASPIQGHSTSSSNTAVDNPIVTPEDVSGSSAPGDATHLSNDASVAGSDEPAGSVLTNLAVSAENSDTSKATNEPSEDSAQPPCILNTSIPSVPSVPAAVHPSSPSTANPQATDPASTNEATSPAAAAPVSASPVSKRSARIPGKKVDDKTKVWTYDAGTYLEGRLEVFNGAELVETFRRYEESLGHPVNKPDVRGNSWPPLQSAPENPTDWHSLFKGGPHGFFLILMALSWSPISNPDETTKITEFITDATWVLCSLTNTDNSFANLSAAALNSKKRKALNGGEKSAKKARLSV